jgi:methylated-DNA-[protein]-cysteine S-methyltransferase
MRPTLVQFEAAGFGVGEVWLERGRVFHTELPRPRRTRPVSDTPDGSKGQELAERLIAFFAGGADDFKDVRLQLPDDGFYADCARALRKVRRGDVVSYGELALLAGYPGAARAAGTFCGRSSLSPFVPTHRVVGANGIGSYGDLGVEYKRRLLALEGVTI